MSEFIFSHPSLIEITKYNNARKEIESRFAGLTHAHRYLVSAMINRADPNTGIVEGLSYRDLAILLTIDHAPGRKGAGIPQKQTIRSYLRTITENCSENFRLLTQGQKLKCQFIHLPKIYAHFLGQKQEYTDDVVDVYLSEPIENTEDRVVYDARLETVKHRESPINDFQKITAKKVLYITKTNKLTAGEMIENFPNTKQPISPNFYPDCETIAIAKAKGFETVTEPSELLAFIRHNQARNTQWLDFNPVYLQWLERGAEYQQRKQTEQHLRSQHNGNHSNSRTRKSPVELVLDLYPDAESPSGRPWGAIEAESNYAETSSVGMVGVDELIRAALYEQTRRENQRLMA